MKVAVVSRISRGSYTSKLVKGFGRSRNGLKVTVYGRKGETRSEEYVDLKQVWTPGLYPLQIIRQACREKPDLVHVQHEFSMFGPTVSLLFLPMLYLALKLARIRVVTTFHTMLFPDSLSRDSVRDLSPATSNLPIVLIRIVLTVVYSSAGNLSKRVIVHQPSHRIKLSTYYGVDQNKVLVMHHGVGATEFTATTETIQKWKRTIGDAHAVLYFGYISPRKGLEYLVEAFARFSESTQDWKLIIAGGITKQSYRGYNDWIMALIKARKLEDKTIVTGFISEEDVDALYRVCKFMVLPYTREVGNASPLNLAMAYGIPVIATRLSPFCEELVDREHAILCDPRNSTELVKAMVSLSTNLEYSESMRMKLLEIGRERTWDILARETEKAYFKS